MSAIRTTLGLTSIVLALAACDGDEPDVKNFWRDYNPVPQAVQAEAAPDKPKEFEQPQLLEGRIVKVQPAQLSYACKAKKNGEVNVYNSSNHEFVYVIVEDKDHGLHTLIHPFSRAILERDATVEFWSLSQGGMRVQAFLERFVSSAYTTTDNFFIEAEGVITPKGIGYK